MRATVLLGLAASTWACTGTQVGGEWVVEPGPSGSDQSLAEPVYSAEQAQQYLSQLAPMLVLRELSGDELTRVEAEGGAAIAPIVEAWTLEPALAEAARLLVQQRLSVSGQRDGINFELPGNLAAHTVRTGLPLSTLLTADYCVDDAGATVSCDTGAPFAAGVLATRAYLKSRAGRFNLTRASTMMNAFACRHYPMEESLQPRVDRLSLITMFQSDTPQDQQDPLATAGFGNGFACYTCHGQFAAHAQVFVRFDEGGVWRSTATGQQDSAGELGRSTGGLYTSHYQDPARASQEHSVMAASQVANLREAASVLAEQPVFVECQVRNLLEYALGLDAADPVSTSALTAIADRARGAGDPTFQALVVATFTAPGVVKAVVDALGGATP